jgi:hypothetical protein
MSETTHDHRSPFNKAIYRYLAGAIVALMVIFGILNTMYGYITNFPINLLLTFLGMAIVYWAMGRSKNAKARSRE